MNQKTCDFLDRYIKRVSVKGSITAGSLAYGDFYFSSGTLKDRALKPALLAAGDPDINTSVFLNALRQPERYQKILQPHPKTGELPNCLIQLEFQCWIGVGGPVYVQLDRRFINKESRAWGTFGNGSMHMWEKKNMVIAILRAHDRASLLQYLTPRVRPPK